MDTEPDSELLALAGAPPPINNLVKVLQDEVKGLKVVIKSNNKIKEEIKKIGEGLKLLTPETQFLDRLLYKHHNRFRNDRGYKSLRILLKSVRKLETVCPLKELTNLSSLLPLMVPSGTEILLPPPSLPQYSGVKVWLATKLMERIDICCRSCGVYAEQRLALGHFWGMAAYHLAVVSRIWTICCRLKEFYEQVQISLKNLTKYLPGRSLYTESVVEKLFGSMKAEPKKESNIETKIESKGRVEFDLGVKLNRSKFSEDLKVQKSALENHDSPQENLSSNSKPLICLKFLANLHSLQDLQVFLDEETAKRKREKKSCVSKKLDQTEWKALKKEVLKAFNQKLPNKSIKLCRKKIANALV